MPHSKIRQQQDTELDDCEELLENCPAIVDHHHQDQQWTISSVLLTAPSTTTATATTTTTTIEPPSSPSMMDLSVSPIPSLLPLSSPGTNSANIVVSAVQSPTTVTRARIPPQNTPPSRNHHHCTTPHQPQARSTHGHKTCPLRLRRGLLTSALPALTVSQPEVRHRDISKLMEHKSKKSTNSNTGHRRRKGVTKKQQSSRSRILTASSQQQQKQTTSKAINV